MWVAKATIKVPPGVWYDCGPEMLHIRIFLIYATCRPYLHSYDKEFRKDPGLLRPFSYNHRLLRLTLDALPGIGLGVFEVNELLD